MSKAYTNDAEVDSEDIRLGQKLRAEVGDFYGVPSWDRLVSAIRSAGFSIVESIVEIPSPGDNEDPDDELEVTDPLALGDALAAYIEGLAYTGGEDTEDIIQHAFEAGWEAANSWDDQQEEDPSVEIHNLHIHLPPIPEGYELKQTGSISQIGPVNQAFRDSPDYNHGELYVYDATSQTFDSAAHIPLPIDIIERLAEVSDQKKAKMAQRAKAADLSSGEDHGRHPGG